MVVSLGVFALANCLIYSDQNLFAGGKREAEETDGEVVTDRGGHSFAVGLLMDGVFFRLGSVEDLRTMTVSQLEALVAMAVCRERGGTKDEHAERIGEYYKVLEEVRNKASQPSKADRDESADFDDDKNKPEHKPGSGQVASGI